MMFDFANTGRPMLFFTYDLEAYRDEIRGFYFDFVAKAPGPLLQTTDELAAALQDLDAVHRRARGPLRGLRVDLLRARRRPRRRARRRPAVRRRRLTGRGRRARACRPRLTARREPGAHAPDRLHDGREALQQLAPPAGRDQAAAVA